MKGIILLPLLVYCFLKAIYCALLRVIVFLSQISSDSSNQRGTSKLFQFLFNLLQLLLLFIFLFIMSFIFFIRFLDGNQLTVVQILIKSLTILYVLTFHYLIFNKNLETCFRVFE